MSPSPDSSPHQKMKSASARRSRISIRPRITTRASIAVLSAVCFVFVLNELRCLKYGCVSRVGFYSGEESFVGGGSVIPTTSNEGMGDAGWDSGAVVSGYETDDEGEGGVELANPFLYDGSFPKEKEQVQNVYDDKGMLLGVEHSTNDAPEKQDASDLDTSIAHPEVPMATPSMSAMTVPTKTPGLGLSKETLLKPIAEHPQSDDPTKDLVVFDSPQSTKPIPEIHEGALGNAAPALPSYADSDSEDFEWDGRENDPPTFTSANNEAFKGSATNQNANWEQAEGQEDPVRHSAPGHSNAIGTTEMKVAMSELLSDFRAT